MNERVDNGTGRTVQDVEPREPAKFAKNLAATLFLIKLAAASTTGIQRCFLEQNAATQIVGGTIAESSTELREITLEIKTKLDAMLESARYEVMEDGMNNVINERLADLIAKDSNAVIPALVSEIEGGRTRPIIAAEVLKELGRLRNTASHASRLWLLERALSLPSPFVRDGAGLGLARLADPDSIPYLRQAIESEVDAQTRADLELVVEELVRHITNGAPPEDSH